MGIKTGDIRMSAYGVCVVVGPQPEFDVEQGLGKVWQIALLEDMYPKNMDNFHPMLRPGGPGRYPKEDNQKLPIETGVYFWELERNLKPIRICKHVRRS